MFNHIWWFRFEIPKFKIIREPQDGNAEFLVAEIELPKIVKQISWMNLSVLGWYLKDFY